MGDEQKHLVAMAKAHDALERVEKCIASVDYMRLSHWAWSGIILSDGTGIDLANNPEAQFEHLSDADPLEWQGEAGTHPLLPFIREALHDLNKVIKEKLVDHT
jgi:hypothetical protein